jgi:hypothetical protein
MIRIVRAVPDVLSQNLTGASVALRALAVLVEVADWKRDAHALVGEEISAITVELTGAIVLARTTLLEENAGGQAFDAVVARGVVRVARAHAVALPARHRATVLFPAFVLVGLDFAAPQAVVERVLDDAARDGETRNERARHDHPSYRPESHGTHSII